MSEIERKPIVPWLTVYFCFAATPDIRKLIKRCKKKPAEAGYLRMPIELNAMI